MPSVEEEKVVQALFNKDREDGNAVASDQLLNMSKGELAALNRYLPPTHDQFRQLAPRVKEEELITINRHDRKKVATESFYVNCLWCGKSRVSITNLPRLHYRRT
jgi:hypothetical protein